MSIVERPFLRTALISALLMGTAFARPAMAFADDEARRAILELREQVRTVTEQNRQARVQLADQIQSLQHEIAVMRGQLERLNWLADQQTNAPADAPVEVADPQEQAAFETPMSLFESGQYQEAATSFTDFLNAYPNSQLAPEAQFYQGSSRYATKDFQGAVEVLDRMVAADPGSPRAPDALLVIAASHVELNNIPGAKAALQKIVNEYPDAPASETAKSRLELLQ